MHKIPRFFFLFFFFFSFRNILTLLSTAIFFASGVPAQSTLTNQIHSEREEESCAHSLVLKPLFDVLRTTWLLSLQHTVPI